MKRNQGNSLGHGVVATLVLVGCDQEPQRTGPEVTPTVEELHETIKEEGKVEHIAEEAERFYGKDVTLYGEVAACCGDGAQIV